MKKNEISDLKLQLDILKETGSLKQNWDLDYLK